MEDKLNETSNIKIFIYEKTYLFISIEPLCKLFENIFYFILKFKKMNFCNNLVDFNSLTNNEIIIKYNESNKESVRIIIINIILIFII